MRYTLERQDGRKLVTTKRERAMMWAEEAALRSIPFQWIETQARFRIKRRPLDAVSTPWILADRERPAFLAFFSTHERAVIGMHNIVRKEHGLPPLIEWRAEHVGQHVQGCVSCYAHNDATTASL